MQIKALDYGEYKGFELDCHYVTKFYRDIQIKEDRAIKVIIKRKRMKKITTGFNSQLYENYIKNGLAYGIFKGRNLIGVIEGSLETWHNVYRVWNFWVEQRYRREGYGTELFNHIEKEAIALGARALILEVQSCNDPAILFYEKMGMHFVGLDTMAYTNEDIKHKEVRLEYGKRLVTQGIKTMDNA